jgi:3-hydroxyisobutyrate dehydrogenase-like beta-hydroxyacid dehydrogenase
MAKLAFVGLGQMGAPMAGRLLEAGHDLAVWNRTPQKADPLVERGARRSSSPADAAEGAEAAVTMLSSPDALEEVLFGSDGLAPGLGTGSTLIEMSTVGPETIHRIRRDLPEAIGLIDAPVLGSVPQASEGALQVFVGGTDDQFGRWHEVLSALGAPIHVGPLGAGASMKLVANSTLGALMTGLGEALALADLLDLDQRAVLDVLADSAIGPTARSKRRMIETGAYPPNFKLALAGKDLRLVTEAAERRGLDLRVAVAARTWLEAAGAADLGDLDYSAVIAHIRGKGATA